nr:Chain A, Genome polyprotein [Hepacivirus hominis]5NPI_D Chain D, Epitope peptide [Hepacivirus hominis]5NPI_E Chain E, Epitope peptide [Hepacivirus hominis]
WGENETDVMLLN